MDKTLIRRGICLKSKGNSPPHCGVRVLATSDQGVTLQRIHACHNGESYQMNWQALENSQWEIVENSQLPLL